MGDSPTEPINPAPDSDIDTWDFEMVQDHILIVYFHPGQGHQENLARALCDFPDITFLIHGDFIRPQATGIMDRLSDVYFTYNDNFDELIPVFRFGEK